MSRFTYKSELCYPPFENDTICQKPHISQPGVFWNPQDMQISKLSLDLKFDQDLLEILKALAVPSAAGHHCIKKLLPPT